MNLERCYTVLREPHLTEKVANLGGGSFSGELEAAAVHVAFKVAPDATKREIAKAVEEIFKVKVERVRVVNIRGKRGVNRSGRYQRNSVRKAYVRLKSGDSIDFTKF
ncbi:MAG: 50S ribosomal protein L23 [Gammaproteobacteria bacterium AqS3]|nr:50S ribosomal protein L23 [Gammaproteobacteria bacterium AqS3]